jgi:hypothetical protein
MRNSECGMRNAEFAQSLYFFAKLLEMKHKIRKDEKIPYLTLYN